MFMMLGSSLLVFIYSGEKIVILIEREGLKSSSPSIKLI